MNLTEFALIVNRIGA